MGLIKEWEIYRTKNSLIRATNQALDLNYITSGLATDMLERLVEHNDKTVSKKRDEADRIAGAVIILMIVTILSGLASSVIFGVFISGSIMDAVKKGVTFAQKVAAGDLRERITLTQRDEMGQLAAALNEAANKLVTVVKKILDTAGELASSSEELSSTSILFSDNAQN